MKAKTRTRTRTRKLGGKFWGSRIQSNVQSLHEKLNVLASTILSISKVKNENRFNQLKTNIFDQITNIQQHLY
jgi:hypothetical protein